VKHFETNKHLDGTKNSGKLE